MDAGEERCSPDTQRPTAPTRSAWGHLSTDAGSRDKLKHFKDINLKKAELFFCRCEQNVLQLGTLNLLQ